MDYKQNMNVEVCKRKPALNSQESNLPLTGGWRKTRFTGVNRKRAEVSHIDFTPCPLRYFLNIILLQQISFSLLLIDTDIFLEFIIGEEKV
ncbi:MAG: hypothetical protein ACQER7_09400 [Bacteroidota bacterium]